MNTSILGHYFIYKFIIFHLVCDYLMRVFSANVLLWLCAWSFVFYHLFTEVFQKFLLIYFHSMCWNQHSPSRTFQVWTSRANFTEPMMARLICQALLASTTLKPMTTRMWSCRYEWYFFILWNIDCREVVVELNLLCLFKAFSNVPPLRNYFLEEENYRGIRRPPGDIMFLLVQRFGELMRKLWNPRNFKAHVSPHEMLQAVVLCSKKNFQITKQGQNFVLAVGKYTDWMRCFSLAMTAGLWCVFCRRRCGLHDMVFECAAWCSWRYKEKAKWVGGNTWVSNFAKP